ncbi:hypothetical protein D3C84_855630 [compost metagenome]
MQARVGREIVGTVLFEVLHAHRAFDLVREVGGALAPGHRHTDGKEALRAEIAAVAIGVEALVVFIGQRVGADTDGQLAVRILFTQVPVDAAANLATGVGLHVVTFKLVPGSEAIDADLLVVVAQLAACTIGCHAPPALAGTCIAGACKRRHTVGDRTA